MSTTTEAVNAINTIESEQVARQSAALAPAEVLRFSEAAVAPDFYRQGDWYLNAAPSEGFSEEAFNSPIDLSEPRALQIEEGTSIGSRHIFDSSEGLELFRGNSYDWGQSIIGRTSEERTLKHPEHTDVVIPAGVNFELVKQRECSLTGEQVRAVID